MGQIQHQIPARAAEAQN